MRLIRSIKYGLDELLVFVGDFHALAILERLRISNIIYFAVVRFHYLANRFYITSEELLSWVHLIDLVFVERAMQCIF